MLGTSTKCSKRDCNYAKENISRIMPTIGLGYKQNFEKKTADTQSSCKLLLVALLESFCKHSDQTPEQSKQMFLYVAHSLQNSGIIDFEFSEELEPIRNAYADSLHNLLSKAFRSTLPMSSTKDSKKSRYSSPDGVLAKTASFLSVLSDGGYEDDVMNVKPSVNVLSNRLNHLPVEALESCFPQTTLESSTFADFCEHKDGTGNLSFSNFDSFPTVQRSRYASDFEELELLGKGGYGSVYKARNKFDGVEYALKKIPLRLRSFSTSSNIFRESRTLARLNHPNVVRFFSSWVELLPSSEKQIEEEPLASADETLSQSADIDNFMFDMDTGLLQHTYPSSVQILFQEDSVADDLTPCYSTKNSTCNLTDLFKKEADQDYAESHDCSSTTSQVDTLGKLAPTKSASEMLLMDSFLSEREEDECSNIPSFDQQPLCLYIQMALCEETLEKHINRRNKHIHGVMSKGLRNCYILLFARILEGVLYLHDAMHLVHRDLKPRNIFLSSGVHSEPCSVCLPNFSDEDNVEVSNAYEPVNQRTLCVVPKIGDFGLVLSQSDNLEEGTNSSAESSFVGTSTYAAPELFSKHMRSVMNNNSSTDIYALGILFFELLYPFNTRMERASAIANLKKGIFPHDFLDSMPEEASLIRSMLSSSNKRPTAAQLLTSNLFHDLVVNELHVYQALLEDAEKRNNNLKAELNILRVLNPNYDC